MTRGTQLALRLVLCRDDLRHLREDADRWETNDDNYREELREATANFEEAFAAVVTAIDRNQP